MNVVLINPYIFTRSEDVYLTEPLGLVGIATYLNKVFSDNIRVTILDLYALAKDKIVWDGENYIRGINDKNIISKKLEELNPDLIGVTCCFSGYFSEALEVAAHASDCVPKALIVMGGVHATLEAESILRDNNFVSCIVRGEGEITLKQLVKYYQGEMSIDAIDGLSYRSEDGVIVSNPDRKLIDKLDELPTPDRSFIDMDFYKIQNNRFFYFSKKHPIATVMTSRGCPYDCVFCCTKNFWKRKWRTRRIEDVVDEIQNLVSRYGIREIVLLDDQFLLDRERVIKFCDLIIEKKMGIALSNIAGLSAWIADDDDVLMKMWKAGFYKLTLPVESGNARTLKFIRKPVELEKVLQLVKKANKFGYWTGAFFIIGFPYETREEIMETIDFAYKSEVDFAHFFVAQPYIGTELYNIYKKENLLSNEIVHGTHIFKSWYDTITMKSAELNQIQKSAEDGWLRHKINFYIKPYNFINSFLPKFTSYSNFKYSIEVLIRLVLRKISKK